MILDTNRSVGRGRLAAAIGFAVLAATVLAVSVAAPLQVRRMPRAGGGAHHGGAPGAAPMRAPLRLHRRDERRSFGTFHATRRRRASSFALQERLGALAKALRARVRGRVSFDAKDGSIRELGPGSSVLIGTGQAQRSQRMRITPGDGAPRQ